MSQISTRICDMMEVLFIENELYDLIDHPIDRAMFILFYHWGLTYKEIAHCFNTNEDEVEVVVLKLKSIIESQYV